MTTDVSRLVFESSNSETRCVRRDSLRVLCASHRALQGSSLTEPYFKVLDTRSGAAPRARAAPSPRPDRSRCPQVP